MRPRTIGRYLLAGALTAWAQGWASAEDWPTRQVTMVVPSAAGGALDAVGRILAPRLAELLGKPVVVENVGGSGGMIGASRVAKAAADGYHFVLGTAGTHAQTQTVYKQPLYDAASDFAPVGLLVNVPIVLVARRDLPAGNLQEFIGYAKANHSTMQYGSPGAASGPHLACAMLNASLGLSITHVPYRGGAPAMQDLIAGRMDYQCPLIATAIGPMEGKLIKALAILSKERSPILANTASAHEQGLRDFEADDWLAFFLPKATPSGIVRKLNAAAIATLETPAVQQRLKEIGANIVASERRSPEYLQTFVESEIKKWAAVIKVANAKAD
jgi:tripartite-type tricarboxylate transporter receptor subunit TctC